MRHLSLIGLKRDKADIIEKLQKLGLVHITGYEEKNLIASLSEESDDNPDEVTEASSCGESEDSAVLLRSDPDFTRIGEEREKLRRCIEELSPFDERKKSLFSFLRPVKPENMADVASRRDEIIAEADRIVSIDNGICEIEEETARTETIILKMEPWKDFPYRPDSVNTRFTVSSFYSCESEKELFRLRSQLSGSVPSADILLVSESKGLYCFVLTCLIDEQREAEKIVSANRLLKYDFSDIDSLPGEYAEKLRTSLESLNNRKKELSEFRKECAKHISDFEILYDYLGISADKITAGVNMSDSSVTFSFEGWIPAKHEKKITSELTDNYICHVSVRDPEEGELPPTKLENGILGSSVEPVESLYSLLKYGELDPSAISAFFYALFFGFMFSDAGYGIMLTVACIVILIKCKLKENMKKYIVLFLFSGISTIFWGVVFGSWFGNLFETVSLGNFAIKPLWFDPQDSANTEHFLAFTLLLGVIHLYAALAMKAANLIAKGKWIDAICDVFFWYIFYTGEVLFLLPYIPYYGQTAFCDKFSKYGIYLLAAGFVLILFTKGRKSKNPFMKLFGGITCLYSLVDMLSDCLSYTRLMAMGLATSVIINVFNSIAASAAGLNTAGITFRFIVFVIIFVAANLFNFAINALGAYVNACRLTYIEFFGKFYEGDGLEYSPLRYNTEYVYIDYGEPKIKTGKNN